VFIALSPTNPDPMYRQVTDRIREAIATGELSPDERLPSIRELAEALKVSVITIKRAYQDLEAGGFILTRPGLGCFVRALDVEDLRAAKLRELKAELTGLLRAARKYRIEKADIIGLIDEIEED